MFRTLILVVGCFISINATAGELFLIGIGGYKSCTEPDHFKRMYPRQKIFRKDNPYGAPIYSQFRSLVTRLQNKGHKVTWMMVCLDRRPPSGEARYVLSTAPFTLGKIRAGRLGEVVFANMRRSASAVTIGFSYGGWLAMYLGPKIARARKLLGVASIDAVSPVDCTLFNRRGCHRAPKDLNYRRVSKSTSFFVNHFQTGGRFSSGRISTAQNFGYRFAGNGHKSIKNDPRVWNNIYHNILKSIKR